MSNSTKLGSLDRRKPTQRVEIINAINKTYRQNGYEGTEQDSMKLERNAFQSAYLKLAKDDKQQIDSCIHELSEVQKIRNLGKMGSIEILAKIGIFLNANLRVS